MEGRRFKQGINTGISIVIFLGILVIINLISNRHYKRFDLTEAKIYTLSDQSKKILKSLKENLFLYGFFKEESEMKPKVTRLFEEYKTSSKYVKYKFIDPDKNPLMAKQYDVRSYDTIVVEYKGKREKVYIPEEKYITKAILKLIKSGKKKVYFTKGHGEKSIEEYGIGGISSLKERLEDEQYQVKEIFLMREGIPSDCDILAICGPEIDFIESEIKEIKKYIEKGGRVLALIDPGDFPRLSNLFSQYGIKIGNDIVVDLASRRFLGDAMSPMIMDYPYHQITKNFNLACLFSWARSVEAKRKHSENINVNPIAQTSPASWAEKDIFSVRRGYVKYDPGTDKRGPISLGVACEMEIGKKEEKKKARIVVFGDSDFITNKFLNFSGNANLILNTFGWLGEEDILISIRKKERENQPLTLTEKQGKIIFFIPVVVIPSVLMIGGLSICIRRRLKY